MERRDKISYLIRRLMAERTHTNDYTIPSSIGEQQYLLRALLNVRPPEPIDDKFLDIQDSELHAQLADKSFIIMKS